MTTVGVNGLNHKFSHRTVDCTCERAICLRVRDSWHSYRTQKYSPPPVIRGNLVQLNVRIRGCDETPHRIHRIHRTHRSLIIFWGGALPRPHPGWARLNCLINTDPNLLPFTTLNWVMSSNNIMWTPMYPMRCFVAPGYDDACACRRHAIRRWHGTCSSDKGSAWKPQITTDHRGLILTENDNMRWDSDLRLYT